MIQVSGQLPPEDNCLPVRVEVCVKVRVSFRLGRQPDNCPERKLPHTPVRFRVWVRVSFGLGAIFLWGNCPRTNEVLFSREKHVQVHPTISLNNIQVEGAPYQKHLGLILDEKLNFKQYIDSAIFKVNKGISTIKQLRYSLPGKLLITIYKAFLRPLTDYGDIIYD